MFVSEEKAGKDHLTEKPNGSVSPSQLPILRLECQGPGPSLPPPSSGGPDSAGKEAAMGAGIRGDTLWPGHKRPSSPRKLCERAAQAPGVGGLREPRPLGRYSVSPRTPGLQQTGIFHLWCQLTAFPRSPRG